MAALSLSACVYFPGYGTRLNADGTLDAVECDGSPRIERIDTPRDWGLASVFGDEVVRSELAVGEWMWSGTSTIPFAPERPCADGIEFEPGPVHPRPSAIAGVGVGFLLAIVPIVLCAVFARVNRRARLSDRGERRFWVFTGLGAVPMVIALAVGVPRILADDPSGLGLPIFLGLPASAVPAIAWLFTSELFTGAEWSAFGYVLTTLAAIAAVPAWALLFVIGMRRLSQRAARSRAIVSAPPTASSASPPKSARAGSS